MAEITRVEELPAFPQAHAEYLVAKRDAGEDPLKLAQADNAWLQKQREFDNEFRSHNDRERAVAASQTRLAEQYPDVPAEIYAGKSPEDAERDAKLFHDKLAEAKPPAAPDQQPSGATGQPPTGLSGQVPTPDDPSEVFAEADRKLMGGDITKGDIDRVMMANAGQVRPIVEKKLQGAG